jgi:hypothetical protein
MVIPLFVFEFPRVHKDEERSFVFQYYRQINIFK